MKKCIIAAAVLLVLTLTACGKKDNDALSESYEELIGDETEESTEVPFTHVAFEVEDQYGLGTTLSADLDIVSDVSQSAKVYDMEVVTVDDAYIKDFAGKLFDNGEYTIEKPYKICSEEELFAEKERLEAVLAEAPQGDTEYFIASLITLNLYYEHEYLRRDAEMTEGQVFVLTEGENHAYDEAECRLRGRIQGTECELTCKYNTYDYIPNLFLYSLEPLINCDYRDGTDERENRCSREEADKTVALVLGNLGYSDFDAVVEGEYYIDKNGGYDEEAEKIGYWYVCRRSYNGIRGVNWDNPVRRADDAGKTVIYPDGTEGTRWDTAIQETVKIRVLGEEIQYLSVSMPYAVGAMVTENAKLLSLEQVVEIIKQYWQTADNTVISRYMHTKNVEIDSFSLVYIIVNYDGKYSLIPAWLLTYTPFKDVQPDMDAQPEIMFAVNALDGSILLFY